MFNTRIEFSLQYMFDEYNGDLDSMPFGEQQIVLSSIMELIDPAQKAYWVDKFNLSEIM